MARIRIEFALAATFVLLAAATAIWPAWIEALFAISPDAGSGESEWQTAAVFGILAVVASAITVRDYLHERRHPQQFRTS
jgi:hypothetical protein